MVLNHIVVVSHQREFVHSSWDPKNVVLSSKLVFKRANVVVSAYFPCLKSWWIFKLWLANFRLGYLDSVTIAWDHNPAWEEGINLLDIRPGCMPKFHDNAIAPIPLVWVCGYLLAKVLFGFDHCVRNIVGTNIFLLIFPAWLLTKYVVGVITLES